MRKLIFILFCSLPALAHPQINTNGGTYMGDESVFYAQTKQVSQFFNRFNGEESVEGKTYYPKDAEYHDIKLRKKYLNILFNNSNAGIQQTDRNEFINQVLNKKSPIFLNFHGNDWFAEVSAVFTYKKEKVNLVIYLKLVKERLGYKWVLSNVYFNQYQKIFAHAGDSTSNDHFLHPMSHEIDFMNLEKIFRSPDSIDYFLEGNYEPDQLALFTLEVKNGNLKFESVSNVKFHFFQVPGWYFGVSYFNRNDLNSGWLIDNLIRINDKDKKELIGHYTHHE
jgi:hypothetical protein